MFRNLRIMTYRKNIKDFENMDINDAESIIKTIDSINKEVNLNLIVLNLNDTGEISEKLEKYLIELNKKILLISKEEIQFKTYFLKRTEIVSDYNLTYFNNDIQYGSKYILKRLLDIFLSIILIIFLSPIFLMIYIYIYILDGSNVVIKQNRVGLHGRHFNMYKFRTMKKDSHKLRDEMRELNQNDEAIFKIVTEKLENF